MKILSFLPVMVCVGLAALNIGFSSCTKEKIIRDTVTVTVRDTINLDTTISTAMLTATAWKIQEIRFVKNNTASYYLRGGSQNTVNLSNENVKFNTDLTGIYTGGDGNIYNIDWAWANSAHTSMVYYIHMSAKNVKITWEHMLYKNGGFRYSEFYTDVNQNAQAQGIRIPINSSNVRLSL